MDYHFEHYIGKRIEGNWPDRILVKIGRERALLIIQDLAKQLQEPDQEHILPEPQSDVCTLSIVGKLEKRGE